MSERRDGGFTLIEVLIAFALGSLIGVVLYGLGATNLRKIGQAKERQEAFQLLERRAREVQVELGSRRPEEGTEAGEFETPDEAFGWEVITEPLHLPLPASYEEDALPSPLFEAPQGSRGPEQPAVAYRVTVRVFRIDDPEQADATAPLRFVAVEPGQPAPQQGQADPNALGAQGNGAVVPPPPDREP